MDPIILFLVIIGTALPFLLALLFNPKGPFKPDGNYHCHIPGCCRSFESLVGFLEHLTEEHYFTDEQIDYVLLEIKRFR